MPRLYFVALPLLAVLAVPAQAEPSPEEVDTARTACEDAFLARDAEAYTNAAAIMIAWGEMQNPDLTREVELCLAFADVIEGVDLATVRARAAGAAVSDAEALALAAPPEIAEANTRLADYLARATADGADLEALARDVAEDDTFAPSPSPDRDALEAKLSAYVRPIPAARAGQNLTAYRALARVNPDMQLYRDRVTRYEQAIEAERAQLERISRQLEARLIRTTAAFDGSSWSRHPSSPRYQDIRDYVTLYLIESGTGQQSMELFVNYTSRDGWLFVQNASINIDGETSRIPISQWFRDNDTEIWEFGSVRGAAALSLASEIAEADRAVIRFNGQQFYDDHVVSETEKRVIQEMLAMWEVISAE